jgi:hypothetical protein
MLLILSLFLLFIGPALQIVFGTVSIKKNLIGRFMAICAFTFVTHFALTVVSFMVCINWITQGGNKCATGAVAILGLGLILGILMIITIIVQLIGVKRNKKAVG